MISCSTSIASEPKSLASRSADHLSRSARSRLLTIRARRSSFVDEELRERLTNVGAMGLMQPLEVGPSPSNSQPCGDRGEARDRRKEEDPPPVLGGRIVGDEGPAERETRDPYAGTGEQREHDAGAISRGQEHAHATTECECRADQEQRAIHREVAHVPSIAGWSNDGNPLDRRATPSA